MVQGSGTNSDMTSFKIDAVISGIDDLEKSGVFVATSPLQQRANEVRSNRVNWQSYLQGQMISQEDYNFITKLDNCSAEQRAAFIKEKPYLCAKTFVSLMGHISKDQTVQYILTMVDDILQEDKGRVELFKEYAAKHKESPWGAFLQMLTRPDAFIVSQASRIVAKLACWSKDLMDGSDLHYYLTWLKDQMKTPNEYLQTVARCLQMMLRIDEYRYAFLKVDGMSTLVTVLAGKVGFQIQYQLTFCIWVMTFNPNLADKVSKYNVIPILSDILSESVKEKVIRIIVASFRNLLEKPTEKDVVTDCALSMVQCKVLKQLGLLEGRKFDDADITDDIAYLTEKLQASVQDLRILIRLLETSRDPLILSVANHDIGEYVRHYPRGKHVIEQLGGKQLVMQHLSHEDPNVRYEALLAVQKLMVHNWEYLGKQLESSASTD